LTRIFFDAPPVLAPIRRPMLCHHHARHPGARRYTDNNCNGDAIEIERVLRTA
jgi:hypothetical protein